MLIALLNFSFELNAAKRCWTQSFETHALCRSHQAGAISKQCPRCSGLCRDCPQGPAGCLTWKVCWPCTGGGRVCHVAGNEVPLSPRSGMGQLFLGSCSVLHLASTRESGLMVPFPLRWHRLNLLNLLWRSERVIFHEIAWRYFRFIFESSVTCLVSSPIPVYLTCVCSYFFLSVVDK